MATISERISSRRHTRMDAFVSLPLLAKRQAKIREIGFFLMMVTKKWGEWMGGCVGACHQVKHGVQAVFGPSDPILGQHIHSICDALDIPHLEARLDLDAEAKEFSINLHPAQSLLNGAYQDVMEFLNWTKVGIIYEEDYGLVKLRELVRSPKSCEMEVHLRQADPDSYRQVLSEMKSKEIRNLIVDTRPDHMHHFLRTDIETFDLEDFKYNFVNITAFRLVDADDVGVRGILRDMERYQPAGNTILNKSKVIQAEPALMYDSVQVFAVGLRTLEQSHALRPANISCELEHPWDGGLSLINYINSEHTSRFVVSNQILNTMMELTSKGLKRITVPPPPPAAVTAGITSTVKAIAAAKADFIANMRRE
uniref:Receptor ligand binding region domain-containing protein n=1 Tax=Vespula pensylvanica TaxID=30213 RepID=A0A834NWX6_VESPE|nr:hypothetical protein H0235_010278 [Vespula pensylvanica]